MEQGGMEAVLSKLGKKLGRKPMLKRKGLSDSSPMKESGMTVVIGMGRGKPMDGRGAMAKRDERGYPMEKRDSDEPMDEMEPESLSAKMDALMERIDALESRLDEYENGGEESDEESDNEEEED